MTNVGIDEDIADAAQSDLYTHVLESRGAISALITSIQGNTSETEAVEATDSATINGYNEWQTRLLQVLTRIAVNHPELFNRSHLAFLIEHVTPFLQFVRPLYLLASPPAELPAALPATAYNVYTVGCTALAERDLEQARANYAYVRTCIQETMGEDLSLIHI